MKRTTGAGLGKIVVVALATVGALTVLQGAERRHDEEHCSAWTPYQEAHPGYYERAVDLCVEGRQAYRRGPFGLLGPSLTGRAAGKCGQLWAAVEGQAPAGPPGAPPSSHLEVVAASALEYYGPSEPARVDRAEFMESCLRTRTRELRARGGSD